MSFNRFMLQIYKKIISVKFFYVVNRFKFLIFDRLNINTTFPLPQKHSVNHSKYKV